MASEEELASQKPKRIDPVAEQVLSLLAGEAAAGEIVLGGYFALQHYADYRTTHDIDAWWKGRANPATAESIRRAMGKVAAARGAELKEREFGETLSFELVEGGVRVFSFQIAVRSVGIDSPRKSAWPPILIETLVDNVGSKMNALVDRGAPRDFTDIKHVVDTGLFSASRCWEAWALKNVGQSVEEARQKVLLHLAGIEARRPVEAITDAGLRRQAVATREWFRGGFVKP